jgi:hypothetical protein
MMFFPFESQNRDQPLLRFRPVGEHRPLRLDRLALLGIKGDHLPNVAQLRKPSFERDLHTGPPHASPHHRPQKLGHTAVQPVNSQFRVRPVVQRPPTACSPILHLLEHGLELLKPRWPLAALTGGDSSYIRREGNVHEELFHVREDAREQHNLVDDPASRPVLQRMREALSQLTAGPLTPRRFKP